MVSLLLLNDSYLVDKEVVGYYFFKFVKRQLKGEIEGGINDK